MRASQYSAASGSYPRTLFDEGADDVVVGVAVLVVEHRSPLDGLLGHRQVDDDRPAVGVGGLHRQLQGVERAAGVARGDAHEVLQRLGPQVDLQAAVSALGVFQGACGERAQVAGLQRQEVEDAAAAYQRLDHLEVRVLGGADQDDRADLHPRQQGVCCALFQRCTSSTNRMVGDLGARQCRAGPHACGRHRSFAEAGIAIVSTGVVKLEGDEDAMRASLDRRRRLGVGLVSSDFAPAFSRMRSAPWSGGGRVGAAAGRA